MGEAQPMSRTAFVTGGTGFVGSNLVHHLQSQGWQVTALHRAQSDLGILKRFDVALACGDLVDAPSLVAAMPQDVEVVFHVASDLNFQSAHNAAQTRTNVDGTRHLVEAALTRGAAHLVYVSTLGTYGDHPGVITEDTPQTAGASSLNYSRSKSAAEDVVRQAAQQGLHATIVNPGGILGPYDRTTWGAFFFLLRDGLLPYAPDQGVMTWCHVEDVVRAMVAAADAGRAGHNYILGGPEADLWTLLELMATQMGMPVRTRRLPGSLLRRYAQLQTEIAGIFGEPAVYTPEVVDVFAASYRCDDRRARQELGYQDRPLRQMVADSHAWLVGEGLL
jgi:nucleoside-diphosphate-sugar epimerase